MSVAIAYEGVTFAYPEAARPAIRDVELEVPEGVFALVVGETGAGKSTLLRAVNGLVPHFTGGTFAGRVVVGGRDTRETRPRDLADVVAYVPQDPAAAFVLDRVEDEIAYGMENLAVEPARMRRRVEEMLDLLGLAPLRDRRLRELSGGERQRVAIAAALATGPRVLVMDEPTSQLDPQGAEDVLAALQRLVHDLGMTVAAAEHRLERVAGFADLVVRLRHGRAQTGAPGEMLDGHLGGPPVARLGRLLGWRPVPLTVRDARARARALVLAPPAEPLAAAPSRSPLAEVRRLDAGYGRGRVLRGVDLEIGRGEVVALMGRNGAGKTTLIRALSGVHTPSSGTVRVAGHEPPRPGVDATVCPQEPESVLFRDTALDEVRTTLAARGSDRRPGEVLELLGIAELARRHPRDCSAGQRLLIAIAAVVAGEPPLLLLDEPTRGLDPDAKARLAAFLRRYAERGHAVVFATHDVELVAAVADRVLMLAGGELIDDGSPARVLGDSPVFAPQMARVFGPRWLTPEQVAAAVMPA